MSAELAIPPDTTVNSALSIGTMMQAIVENGVTPENADALGKMMDLYERMKAKDAEAQFNAAFVKFQEAMPEIVAQSDIPNRGKYERYEDILHVARPLLIQNGFTVNFSQAADGNRIVVTCKLRHKGGYSTDTAFAVRLGNKADSETQADCKASTTAKRNALCLALNIIIRQNELDDEENDARLLGEPVDDMAAAELERRAKEVGANIPAFLQMFGVNSFHHVPLSRLEEAHEKLDAKARKSKGAAQ